MKIKSGHLAFVAACLCPNAFAQAGTEPLRIGFVTDMSGPYSDLDGAGGLSAIRMAVEDFGGKVLGRPIEVLSSDHQNKADIAANKARQWWDQDRVELVIGGSNSSASLAISTLSKEKKKVFISAGAGADSLTEEACQPYMVRYTYSTSAQARGTANALTSQGEKSWYFVTADYAFGHSLEAASINVVKNAGGSVKGNVRHPLNASDFSSYLLQAQASGAQVIGLANGGTDLITSIKTAKEFGIGNKARLAGLMVFITDIHALGLDTTAGMYLTDGWYWDLNAQSRAFANRYFERNKKMPTTFQAGDYSATMTYLKAVQAAQSTDADKVMAALKSLKIDDMFAKGYIRADGAMVHDMYLMQVKKRSESQRPWDYYRTVATIPGEVAYAPTKPGACHLLPAS
ncbi:ABC transporter substrate-binding protein [Pseudorhodoferax sp.]|uniref:ABC transporter substrate-binding protein n=1 Tax=Pseudorhodoferax sp. TaxID=1993553 RepID=UPI002DD644D3|nr:ABC transporter substrate-binding protein [Pseudorhodoferax sp.]